MRLAQLDRAFGYGPKGRGFESSNARWRVFTHGEMRRYADAYLLIFLRPDRTRTGSDLAFGSVAAGRRPPDVRFRSIFWTGYKLELGCITGEQPREGGMKMFPMFNPEEVERIFWDIVWEKIVYVTMHE